jgi:thiol-disulfide isomerase/thioredoxin
MIYLTAAVILVGAVGMMNLVLLLGILRRLRAAPPAAAEESHGGGSGLRLGWRPEPFAVSLLHGGRLTRSDLTGHGETLIGFFSPTCRPCRAQAPKFAARAAEWPGGPERVLVVVADDTVDGAEFTEQFAGLAKMVVDGLEGPVATAYGVTAFPAFGILDDTATVLTEATSVERLADAAPALTSR